MTFHDHAIERANALGDRRMVFRRNRAWIKKAAAVVEFDLARGRELGEREIDLRRDGSGRHGSGERVLPQVAHQAAPRALAIRQEDRRDRHDFAGLRTLLFDEKRVWTRGLHRVSRSAPRENPAVALRRRAWVAGGVRGGRCDPRKGHGGEAWELRRHASTSGCREIISRRRIGQQANLACGNSRRAGGLGRACHRLPPSHG